jgi:hypothetical protein
MIFHIDFKTLSRTFRADLAALRRPDKTATGDAGTMR